MKTDDFDYFLPEELIAQTPLLDRSSSRLLVLDRKTATFADKKFTDILDYLHPGDALVLNETKVIPARIIGSKAETHGLVELLLLKELGNDTWECLARPQKRLHHGTKIFFGATDQSSPETSAKLTATVLETLEEGITRVKFSYQGIFLEILDQLGTMPLPPYIHRQLGDNSRYQTVYAKVEGSAAAPTAGFHFTPELFAKLENKGVEVADVTLHVGLGTFRPVKSDDIREHTMHSEFYCMDQKTADQLNRAKQEGRRIIAIGTTSTRTLETIYHEYHTFKACSGDTKLFIYPGFRFEAIDCLITNFHLPKSTLVMLVSAFSTRDNVLRAYRHAVEQNYRFFSFGDSMFLYHDK